MGLKVKVKEKARAKRVQGGIDHGTMWESIAITPKANPEEIAAVLVDSYNERWCKELAKSLIDRMGNAGDGARIVKNNTLAARCEALETALRERGHTNECYSGEDVDCDCPLALLTSKIGNQ